MPGFLDIIIAARCENSMQELEARSFGHFPNIAWITHSLICISVLGRPPP